VSFEPPPRLASSPASAIRALPTSSAWFKSIIQRMPTSTPGVSTSTEVGPSAFVEIRSDGELGVDVTTRHDAGDEPALVPGRRPSVGEEPRGRALTVVEGSPRSGSCGSTGSGASAARASAGRRSEFVGVVHTGWLGTQYRYRRVADPLHGYASWEIPHARGASMGRRRQWGSVRRLPSDRYQARLPDGVPRPRRSRRSPRPAGGCRWPRLILSGAPSCTRPSRRA
jgi:hypothetical protein